VPARLIHLVLERVGDVSEDVLERAIETVEAVGDDDDGLLRLTFVELRRAS